MRLERTKIGKGNPSQWTLLTFAAGPLPLETEKRDEVRNNRQKTQQRKKNNSELWQFTLVYDGLYFVLDMFGCSTLNGIRPQEALTLICCSVCKQTNFIFKKVFYQGGLWRGPKHLIRFGQWLWFGQLLDQLAGLCSVCCCSNFLIGPPVSVCGVTHLPRQQGYLSR